MQNLWQYITPTLFLPLTALAFLALFFLYYWHTVCPRGQRGTLAWVTLREARERLRSGRRLTFADVHHPMRRLDVLLLVVITLLYAGSAFWNLGSATNPQSCARIENEQSVAFALEEKTELSRLVYYPGLGTGSYTLEGSTDGVHWFYLADVDQSYTTLYKWMTLELPGAAPVSALRLTAHGNKAWLDQFGVSGQGAPAWLELGEVALYDAAGARLVPQAIVATRPAQSMGAADYALFDEPSTVPVKSTWYNSTYFDEIYHARTAQEHLQGVYPYEITHPPLGKLLLGLGIRLFGMTPLGWRFMGTLFGVGMLPLLYLFLKNLFGKTAVAVCGTLLLATDFMHLTQTRIATIDTYGVFFILAMYYFLYRWLALPAGSGWRRGALWLFLSGLCWGLGAASKWTVVYGAVGLALLYFIGLWLKLRDWPHGDDAPLPGPWAAQTICFSVLCFVVLPAALYCAAYLPYAAAEGELSLPGVLSAMWENQVYMLNYHRGVTQSHPYSSRWYQWIVDGRPILYYLDNTGAMRTSIAAFNNPVLCWGGLIALVSTIVQFFRRHSGKALFIIIAYFSQLIPWLPIGRTTFAYHYFPSSLFLVLALCFVFDDLLEQEPRRARAPIFLLTGGAAALYALFYPVLVGIAMPVWFPSVILQWLPSWPL